MDKKMGQEENFFGFEEDMIRWQRIWMLNEPSQMADPASKGC